MEAEISPVPSEARPYQGQHAGLVTRVIASTVDGLAIGAALVAGYLGLNVARFLISPRDFQVAGASLVLNLTIALALLVLYLALAWSITGRTYGDHLMGVRVVGRRGRPVRLPTALVRALFCVVFPIGLLWCAGGKSRRSLQDRALRTSVIYDWTPRRGQVTLTIES